MNPQDPHGQPYPVQAATPTMIPAEPQQTPIMADPVQAPAIEQPQALAELPEVNANLLEQITVRARHVVMQTAQDPHEQAIQLEQLKREYIEKQYGQTYGKDNK